MSAARIKYLEDKINNRNSVKNRRASGNAIARQQLENDIFLAESELKRIAKRKGYILRVPKDNGSISYKDNTGLGGNINSIQNVDKTANERIAAAAASQKNLGSKKASTDGWTTHDTAANRRKEFQRVQALAKNREKEEAARKEREAAAKKPVKPRGRARIKSGMLDDADSREQRDKSKERRNITEEQKEWSEKLKFIETHNLKYLTDEKLKKHSMTDLKEIAKTHKWQMDNRASHDKDLRKVAAAKKEQERLKAQKERKEERERINAKHQKRPADERGMQGYKAAEKKKDYEQKEKILGEACKRFFGDGSFLYRTFNITNDPVKMQALINNIVHGLIKAEIISSQKDAFFHKLANEIFLYIHENSEIKGDQFDELLNKIIMNNSLHTELVSLNNNYINSTKHMTTREKHDIITYDGRLKPDTKARTNFVHLMGKLYTNHTRKPDIIRTYLLEQNKKGKKYLQKATPNTTHKRAVIRQADTDIYSQTHAQQDSGYFMRNGKRVPGVLEGDMQSAATFDPKSLNTSQRKPLDSKFFTEGDYGQTHGEPLTLSRYFSYSGMIRSYEHNFYIPGDDTKYESVHQARELEYQTNERSGTIEDNVWYSQKADGRKLNWVWKQSMKGEDKSRHSWKHIKKDFKNIYIHKQDNIDKVFEDFVKQQENNPRYIIFKGITSALFRSPTTQQRNAFHYGFIDTESGIELGDYIMFECINDYHETSTKAFLALQPPHRQTPLMFFIHKGHLNPPKDATKDELQDWANKRSILSEYEYRGLFLNKLMDKDSQPLMEEIQSLTDFTTAGKYCEDPNSINKNHTELCYSTGEKDEEGKPIYKSNVKFPEEQFKATSNEESGILAIQYSVLVNFITETGKQIENLEKTKCTDKEGEPCFELILKAYDKIASFKTTAQQRLDVEMEPLTEYILFLHQILRFSPENEQLIKDEIKNVENFRQSVTKSFNKQIKSKELNTILKNLFNKNGGMLIKFKEIKEEELKWVSIEKDDVQKKTFKLMEDEWKEQKEKFNKGMEQFQDDLAEAASDLKDKIAERDNEIAAILLKYNTSSKKAYDEKAAEEAREAAALLEQARLAKEEKDKKEAARLKKEAEKKAKEAVRLKKEADEKAKRENEAARKKVLLAALRKWQETYEKEKREEERRVLMEEIRKNYNKAIEHNIKIRQEINNKLEELGQKAKELLETADPDIYTNMMDVNSKWGTQITSLKDAKLTNELEKCATVFTELLGNVNDLLTQYAESHLSPHATNIEEFKNKLEKKIDECEGFIKEVNQFEQLIKLNEYFDDDGKVIDSSLGNIVDAIQIIDITMNPNENESMTLDEVSQKGINEDPVPKVMMTIIKELKNKLENKEKEMKDVVTVKLNNIHEQLMENEKEMEDILKEYGYNTTSDEKEQNDTLIKTITQIITLFNGLKHIMEQEENIEIEIKNIFEVKEEKIPDDETPEEEEERMRGKKTNAEELDVIKNKKVTKEALETKLEFKKQELEEMQGLLTEQLKALRMSLKISNFRENLVKAFKTTTDIFNDVNKIKEEYKDIATDHHEGEQPRLIGDMFKQFENIIGDGFSRKKQVIEFIKDILEKNLETEGVKIVEIQKIINGGDKSLDIELVGAPDLLINITKFLLEEIIYKKALINNGNWFKATQMENDRLEQARLRKEGEIKEQIKKEEEERIEAERQAKLKAQKEKEERIEAERLQKLAIAKEKYEKTLKERQNYFEEAERNYEKLLSKYDESRYSKETQDLNNELMERIFKVGLLHSDQKYMEKGERKKGVEDWFATTPEGQNLAEPEEGPGYEHKLKKYNEAMKETNEIFG